MNNTFPFKKIKAKRSPVWSIPLDQLLLVVKQSNTITEILKYFGLINKGSNYRTLMRRFKEENIDFSHVPLGKFACRGKKFPNSKKIPLEEVLIKNSTYARNTLKKRLLKENLLKNECYICGQLPTHNNQPLSLQLDHINGVSNDNRIENLRILCPNCHSQTTTFAGKQNKIHFDHLKPSQINPDWRKTPRPNSRKVERPTKEELEKLLWEKPTLQIAKDFGVSDKAIEKWAKIYNLNKPPRGYWAKLNK